MGKARDLATTGRLASADPWRKERISLALPPRHAVPSNSALSPVSRWRAARMSGQPQPESARGGVAVWRYGARHRGLSELQAPYRTPPLN
jgi:hypothetical protein